MNVVEVAVTAAIVIVAVVILVVVVVVVVTISNDSRKNIYVIYCFGICFGCCALRHSSVVF